MVFPGGAKPHLVSGVALLRPDEQVLDAMLEGWRNRLEETQRQDRLGLAAPATARREIRFPPPASLPLYAG
ncbi:hypothetical protein [Catenulispora rubra]|uniref:hypothetical protein n=1 Tax=Catenulispora rubra TaxID=280293 RepID=UPI0018923FD3|nr:hypothetical protein [Catenulispora rubra]